MSLKKKLQKKYRTPEANRMKKKAYSHVRAHFENNKDKYIGKAESWLKDYNPEHYKTYMRVKHMAASAAKTAERKYGINYKHLHDAIKDPKARQKLIDSGTHYLNEKLSEKLGTHMGGVTPARRVNDHHHLIHALEKRTPDSGTSKNPSDIPVARKLFEHGPELGYSSLGNNGRLVGFDQNQSNISYK